MSTIVQLPDEQTAVLKDDSELTNREARNLRTSAMVAASIVQKLRGLGQTDDNPESWIALSELTPDELAKMDIFQGTCVLVRLVSWSLDRPIPESTDEVDDLQRSIYVPLTVAATDIKWSDDFTPEAVANPKAGTAKSASSRQRSKAR